MGGGLAGAGSLTIVYPLDYARTRLASDVGSGNPQFTGLFDCLTKTISGGGFFSMYNGFGVSVVGIVAYRGPYFGVYDTLKEKNPFKKDKGFIGIFSKFCIAQFTAIVCRCSRRSPRRSGCTPAPSTAPSRLSRTRAWAPFSRASPPACCAPWAVRLCWWATMRSRPCSLGRTPVDTPPLVVKLFLAC